MSACWSYPDVNIEGMESFDCYYLKSTETGETITLTLSSPVELGGPKAMTGSFTFLLRRLPELRGRGSSDLSRSARSAALYSNVWSATHVAGYMNSVYIFFFQ